MPHTLVDRQPEVGRVQHQIVFTGLDQLGLQLFHRFVAGLLGLLEPGVAFQIFIPNRLRAGQRGALLVVASGRVHGRYVETGSAPNDVLFEPRALGRGEEFLLVLEEESGFDEAHPLNFHRGLIDFQKELDFVVN